MLRARVGLMSTRTRTTASVASRAPRVVLDRVGGVARASVGGGASRGWRFASSADPTRRRPAGHLGVDHAAFAAAFQTPARLSTRANDADTSSSSSASIYSDPRVYELAFGFRDFDAEIAFVRAACERLGTGRLDAFLELGAGPAWHSVACGQNIPGARAVAVDNSPAMLARARERVASANLESTVAVVEGDMTALDVDALRAAADAPDGFDAACILLGTAAHLVDTDDAVACLRGAADALRPGGVVILELEHPFDIFDGQLMDAQGDAWDREVDGVKILVEWGREGDYFDVATHVVERTVGFNVVDPVTNAPVAGWDPIEETVPCRVFTAPEIALVGRLAGLRVVGTFGDVNLDTALDDDDANNMIVVLKKPEE